MPLAQRRPVLLHLTLPHPPLSCLPTTNNSKSSMSEQNPITPVNQRRDSATIIRASVDSWCSNDSGNSSMSVEYEWTPAQIQLLCTTLENLPSHLFTPYVGSVPPQNILQKLARGVKDGRGSQDWPHSIRTTRQMLHKLATKLAVPPPVVMGERYIDRNNKPVVADATNSPKRERPTTRAAPPKIPLYRKNSMDDLLPGDSSPAHSTKENSHIDRASARLQQRADRFFTFHPYAHTRQRDSMISAISDPTNDDSRSPVVEAPLAPPIRRSIRRTASSTSSQLATVNEGHVPMVLTPTYSQSPTLSVHPLTQISHRTSNPCITRVRHSGSFVRPLSTGDTDMKPVEPRGPKTVTLKRAPSYGTVAQTKKEDLKEKSSIIGPPLPPPKITTTRAPSPATCSSDEEEKKRTKTIKRMKTIHRKPSYLGAELPTMTAVSSPRLPSYQDQHQSITVEEFTMANMVSMESLPSLSSSSSVTQLSMRSVATAKTRASTKSRSGEKVRSPTTNKKEHTPPVPSLPERAMSHSPPRTLRRVGNKSLRLEPVVVTSGLVSPPREIKPRPKGLRELGRKISFGSPSETKISFSAPLEQRTSGGSKREALLLAAGLSLSSPFEEKKGEPATRGPSSSSSPKSKLKSAVKYLF